MKKHELIDETDFFQIGQSDPTEFWQVEFGSTALPSTMSIWPEKDKNGFFKFDSFYM